MIPAERTFRYPREVRLRRSTEIRVVQRTGSRRSTPYGTVCVLPNTLDHPRFGFAVSRKVGNAVTRNRIKRRMREVFRHLRPQLPGVDVMVLARPAAAQASLQDLEHALHRALSSWKSPQESR